MSTETTNLHLVKPGYEDLADIEVINANMDIIDEACADIQKAISRYNTTYTFSPVSAGAAGYVTIPISVTGRICNIYVGCSTIAKTNGLQLTPIFINNSNLYVNYHAPRAITENLTLSVYIDTYTT